MQNSKIKPSEFYEDQVLPVMLAHLDRLFPEFGWVRIPKGWEATIAPDGFACSPHRISCLERAPFYISVVDSDTEGMTWLQYLNGGVRMPSGEDFVIAIQKAASIAGVDSSVLTVKNLTPEQLKRIEQDQQEHRKKAEARRREQEKQRMQDDAIAIDNACKLIGQAQARDDRSAAERYFKKRGCSIDRMPGGELPKILVHTPDAGFKGQMIGAVICPVWTSKGFVGCQRLFIEQDGTPIEYRLYSNKDPVRKAALGRCDGGACVIGEPRPGEPVVLCEGVETAVMIHQLTHWCVMACISAGGMERVDLELVQAQLSISQSVVIVAGDLDKSERGQRAMVRSADRIRFGLKVAVAECIPSRKEFPALIGLDEKPIEGKSVDWEDAIKHLAESFPDYAPSLVSGAERATSDLTKPEDYEEAVEEQCEPDIEGEVESDPPAPSAPLDHRKFKPYAAVYPKQQLDAAHEYLLTKHGPEKIDRDLGSGLRIVCHSDRIHMWSDGCYTELEGKPADTIRGAVRRHFRKHCKGKATKEDPPRIHYVDADLSKSEIDSVTAAAIDEIRVILPINDFTARCWLRPNVESGAFGPEVIEDDMAWGRVIKDPGQHGLPPADQVIPTREGIFDVQAWRADSSIDLIPPTPLLFNLGCIEASIPVEDAIESLRVDGLDGLEEFAWSLCPEWRGFLERTFAHTDPECVPAVIRELHKWMGNLIGGDIGYQNGNIAWLVGPPRTGKSVILKVVEALLGINNIVSSTMSNLDTQFHLRSWIGKMLAVFPDMDIGRVDKKKIVELIKLISGGDLVPIDRKHLNEIPGVRLGTRIAIAANQMPGIPDPTLAIAERSIAFELRHTVKLVDRDPRLPDRLTSPHSLAGIMLLSLIGIKHLDADQGFIQPKWFMGLINDLKAQSSEYAELINQYIEIELEDTDRADAWVSHKDLYTLFKKSCEDNGQTHYPKLQNVIAQLKVCLTGHGWARNEPTRVGGLEGLQGLRINDRGRELMGELKGEAAGGIPSAIPMP